jgi:hypothetical protein
MTKISYTTRVQTGLPFGLPKTREWLHPGIPCLVGSSAISSVSFC